MSERAAILKGVVFFRDLAEEDLNEVARKIVKRSYKLG